MRRFTELKTDFEGVYLVSRNTIADERGYFERLFSPSDLKCWGPRSIKQINRSFTKSKGTIRGLHFQNSPFSEAKLICCIKGVVMDVALDLRKQSKTYGKIYTVRLAEEKNNAVFIPEGFAHGFQTLSNSVEIIYFHSNVYAPMHEVGINALDPALEINWQLPCKCISDRDRKLMKFSDFTGFN